MLVCTSFILVLIGIISFITSQTGTSGNNDGLTKQQLDLIHQIMEQTQRQSQPVTKSPSKTVTKPTTKQPTKVQRVWTSPVSIHVLAVHTYIYICITFCYTVHTLQILFTKQILTKHSVHGALAYIHIPMS